MKELLKQTLGIKTEDIPTGGKTISKDEMFLVLRYVESVLKRQLNSLQQDRDVKMVYKNH